MTTRARILQALGMAIYALILLWLYYPAWEIFFSTDDWVSLYHIQRMDLRQPWEFFNFHTVLSYRPFQLLQYALSWHFFKLNPVGYNVQLFLMFLLVCLLVWELIRIQFGLARANITAAFLGLCAATPEVLIWKYNFNTYQNVILTLGAAILFARFLQSKQRAYLYSVWALVGVNCFTRESAVNLPLILLAPWIVHLQENKNPIVSWTSVKRTLKIFGPMGGVVFAFTIVYFAFYKNTSPYYALNYNFVNPFKACFQWTVCLGSLIAMQIYPQTKIGELPLQHFPLALSFIGISLILLAAFWKNLTFRFALMFSAALLFPTCALKQYLQSRYYYPASGIFMGLVVSELIVGPIWIRGATLKLSKSIVITAMCILMVRNTVATQQIISDEIERSHIFESGYKLLSNHGHHLEKGTVVFVTEVPEKWLLYGIGCPEMVMMALNKFAYGFPYNYIAGKNVRTLTSRHPALLLNFRIGTLISIGVDPVEKP